MKAYREAFAARDFEKAQTILKKSDLSKDKKSALLWHVESGTVAHSQDNQVEAIKHFQISLDLIDELYTKKLSAKAATLFINDASDVFYGASYERSYAHYFLAKSYYAKYLKTNDKLDLQGARATILAWDTYFTDLQRMSTSKTLYQTDLMLKVFGGEIHEVSEVRNDKQIALQLYKDALKILDTQGGIFSLFNKSNLEYIKSYEAEGKAPPAKLYEASSAQADLKKFIQYKILSLTKEVRSSDFQNAAKLYKVSPEIQKRASNGSANVVLVLEEGLIPEKVGKPFNFGIKGAMNAVPNEGAKKFIATVGTEFVTAFAMNKLGMVPTDSAGPGNFIFAHSVTKLAVQEAAIEFELPMIENVPLVQRLEIFILDEKGVVVEHHPLPVVSDNGDIARIVLEEDVVARYTKTGARVAFKHIVAIVAAMQVYQNFNSKQNGDFLAKAAAMATYIASSKGIAAMEKADTRHWTTLPRAMRMTETKLPPGKYQVGIGAYSGDVVPKSPAKLLGEIQVKDSGKAIHHLQFLSF